jgi:hypothetical protein
LPIRPNIPLEQAAQVLECKLPAWQHDALKRDGRADSASEN